MDVLRVVIGWVLTLFIGGLGVILLWKMGNGKINLAKLISEPDGDASLSRFQFLIFTFVISMSLFFVTVSNSPWAFPEIPSGILALLGMSAGSYIISKGIQTSRDTTMAKLNKKDE